MAIKFNVHKTPQPDGRSVVKLDNVNFRCSEKMTTTTCHMPEERKMRMLDYLHRHESITTIMYTNLNTCSRYQAKTDLKKYIFLLSLLFTSISFQAQQAQLSKDAEISLLTVSPSEDEVYTVYGHTALRVKDPSQKLDAVFNYGIFDFSKPNFIYRFAKGETDYKLAAQYTRDFMIEYEMRGSEVTEQILNLDSAGKARIWEALLINNRPENRVYRYNFFFDNCATRPAAIIEKQSGGKINYHAPFEQQTFRDLINYSTRNKPWLTFGCDLALGSPTDRIATIHEMMFLPLYLKEAFGAATITGTDGSQKELVSSTDTLISGLTDEARPEAGFFTPLVCCWGFFLLVLAITYIEWHWKTYFRIVDFFLFFIAGVAGVVLFFLCFVSTHPCIRPNWNIIWLQPFDLIAVILFAVKKLRKAAYYYHFINFAALTLMLAGWYFIPQHLNTAFIPLVMSLWLRSGYGVYRKIWNIGYEKY